MVLSVTTFASYLTTRAASWRPIDHDALKFVKLLKGKPFGGYGNVHVRGQWHRFEPGDRATGLRLFAAMLGDFLKSERINPKSTFALVPIPSTEAVVGATFDRFPTRDIASACASELVALGVTRVAVSDILRWTTLLPKAHESGASRDPHHLLAHLAIHAPLPLGHIILVDDVLTTGGHLRAAAHLITSSGGRVWRAACPGRTYQVAPADPFAIATEPLPGL